MQPERFAQLLGRWSDGAMGTLPDRLSAAIGRAANEGLLPTGTRLPPERQLAKLLAVSRPTVAAAYDRLRDRGVLTSRQGSGTWVAHASPSKGPADRGFVDQALDGGINLGASIVTDASDLGELALTSGDLLRSDPSHGYAPAGLPALREACAAYHRAQGLDGTSADHIAVTTGAHDGLALALRSLVRRGDVVLSQEYAYPGLLEIADACGLALVGVADEAGGLDIGHLEGLLRRLQPKALVIQPSVTNPTGAAATADQLDAIAAALRGVEALPFVIEDNTLTELAFARTPSTLAHRLPADRVVSVETLSKTAWGGLRIGWLRGTPTRISAMQADRDRLHLGDSVPSQLLALAVLGSYPDLLEHRLSRLYERAGSAVALLNQHLPEWGVDAPAGGLSLWAQLPVVDAEPFAAYARRAGVGVLPGSLARPDRAPDPHVRICFDRPLPVLEEGVARLASAWRSFGQRPVAAPPY